MQEHIQEQKKSTLEYLMYYGALLGIFWIVKYMFFIGKESWIHFIYFYHLLNVVSPLLMYIFYLRYKSETPEMSHGIWQCVLFILGISFFGSLFESVIIYAHYTYISPEVFASMSSMYTQNFDQLTVPENFTVEQIESFNMLKEMFSNLFSSKLLYIISNIIGHLFVGFVFSLLIGFLTRNKIVK